MLDGVHRFESGKFGKFESLFQHLADDGQHPHTLFIACCDSRVLAELITQSRPGDLFVVKNIGNIVPENQVGGPNSTAAAIEFAVNKLEVKNIVVCGHSQCGAMEALMADDFEESCKKGHLGEWIRLAEPVRQTILEKYSYLDTPEKRCTAAGEENVLFGLENLESYECIARRLAEGKMHLYGWFFHIKQVKMYAYNPESRQFEPIVAPGGIDAVPEVMR